MAWRGVVQAVPAAPGAGSSASFKAFSVDHVIRKIGGLEKGLAGLGQVNTRLSATTAANVDRRRTLRDHLSFAAQSASATSRRRPHPTPHVPLHTLPWATPASIDDASSVATSLSGAPAQRNVPSYMQSTANRERSASKAARRGSTIGRGSVSSPGNGMGSSRRIQGPGDYEDEGLASSSPRERARTRSTAAPLESPSGGSRMRRRASAAKERTENTNITVAVRVRPLNEKELNEERLHLEGHPYDDPTTWQVENADIWETDHVQDEEMAAGGTRERHEQIKKQNRSSKRWVMVGVGGSIRDSQWIRGHAVSFATGLIGTFACTTASAIP